MTGEIENRDYVVTQRGARLTPDQLSGRLDSYREKYFDMPLHSTPHHSEADRALKRPESESERYELDHAPYLLDDPIEDRRIRTDFEWYEECLLAVRSNISTVLTLKRRVKQASDAFTRRRDDQFAMSVETYGADMGRNDRMRDVWFRNRFKALVEICEMYQSFLDEIDIELYKMEGQEKDYSRALSALETEANQMNFSGSFKTRASVR